MVVILSSIFGEGILRFLGRDIKGMRVVVSFVNILGKVILGWGNSKDKRRRNLRNVFVQSYLEIVKRFVWQGWGEQGRRKNGVGRVKGQIMEVWTFVVNILDFIFSVEESDQMVLKNEILGCNLMY